MGTDGEPLSMTGRRARRMSWRLLIALLVLAGVGVEWARRTRNAVPPDSSAGADPTGRPPPPPSLAGVPSPSPTPQANLRTVDPDSAAEDARRTVTGRVIDDDSGLGVAGARVVAPAVARPSTIERAVGDVAYTAADGTFTLLGPRGEPGTVELLVAAEGYVPRHATAAPTSMAEIRLHRGSRISGRVVDLDAQPIEGVEVLAVEDGTTLAVAKGEAFTDDLKTANFAWGRSDASGRFVVHGVKEGHTYRVTPRQRGWAPTPREHLLGIDVVAPQGDVVLQMERAFEARLIIRDALTHEPIPHPSIRFGSSGLYLLPPHLCEAQTSVRETPGSAARSDVIVMTWSAGRAVPATPPTPEGVHLVVSALGYDAAETKVALTRADATTAPTPIDLRPTSGVSRFAALRLRFVDVDGHPQRQGRAFFVLRIGDLRLEFPGRDLDDGIVYLARIPAGEVVVEPIDNEQADGTFDPLALHLADGGRHEVSVRLRRLASRARLVVEATDDDHRPLAACDITVSAPTYTCYRHASDPSVRPLTRHAFTLPPGPTKVHVRRAGYEPETRSVELKVGTDEHLAVRLRPLR